MSRHLFAAVPCCLLSLSAALPARAQPKGSTAGEQWEQTLEMTFQGRTMKSTQTTCLPKGDWSDAPVKGDAKCRATDVKRGANSLSWKMTCDDGSTGDGQMTRTGDSMSGKMRMRPKQEGMGEMTTLVTGRRLGGSCDVDAKQAEVEQRLKENEQRKRQQEQMMSQLESDRKAAQTKACRDAASRLDVFVVKMEQCASEKPTFCSTLSTSQGYLRLKQLAPEQRTESLQLCGKTDASLRQELCAAEAPRLKPGNADETRASLRFVGAHCPDESKVLAQRECAGRSFTGRNAPEGWVYEFCTRYASEELRAGRSAESRPASTDPKPPARQDDGDLKNKATKAAKGLFGF